MHRTRYWVLGGLLVLVAGLIVLSTLEAQRPRPEFFRDSQVGRYQAIKVDGEKVFLLDTATGDLYRASLAESKPYAERPRQGDHAFRGLDKGPRRTIDKEKLPDQEKGFDKDKDVQKDKGFDKAPPKDKDFAPPKE
jgi:hypothetical protein